MHNIIQLKGNFISQKYSSLIHPRELKCVVTSSHLKELSAQLKGIKTFWTNHGEINGALVTVHYTRVVAKSNRIQRLLKDGSILPNSTICGAKFGRNSTSGLIKNHIITHFISLKALDNTIGELEMVASFIDNNFQGNFTEDCFQENCVKEIGSKGSQLKIKKTNFRNIIVDSSYVERFSIESNKKELSNDSIISIYKTNVDTTELLQKFGIQIFADRIINQTTLQLYKSEIRILQEKAPYLIAMGITDFTKISADEISDEDILESCDQQIPSPQNEPIIGVIDTGFNQSVYFSEWVDYHNMLKPGIELQNKDLIHGTEVDSIIVDGVKGNPRLNDHCGRFRVRHFCVSTSGGFSSFEVLRLIRQIVEANQDIKVWNLSLGSVNEVSEDFISPEAAELDRIQSEYDIIFVVAGTNKNEGDVGIKHIGAPADSLNSVVVNAVNFRNKPASYSRSGPVLSFFQKPDISFYGGDGSSFVDKMVVCKDNLGASYVCGTSFAAPWMARKLCYLINIMGFPREIAKAILIDSAAGWSSDQSISSVLGYGIVPIDIRDVLRTADDEIKFYITGETSDYETFNYNLPIPTYENKYPFYAKATMVYFPSCNRNQGVDYTGTEIDLHLGRLKSNAKGKIVVSDIKGNEQANEGNIHVSEKDARNMYHKWNNVKHVCEKIPAKRYRKAKKMYLTTNLWGIRLISTERSYASERNHTRFGLVISLKEMNGKNRYVDFIKGCQARGWIVNEISIDNAIDIQQKAEENIELT